jgi:type IV secretory pathway component VirB8
MDSFLETDRRRLESERLQAAETAARERRAIWLAAALFALIAALSAGAVLALIF